MSRARRRGVGLRFAAAWVPCVAALAAPACGWFSRALPPPAARGIVLVLASGLEPGTDASRTPRLQQLVASGRPFAAAFAADPNPAEARAALLGSGSLSLGALFRARGLSVAALGDGLALGTEDADAGFGEPAAGAGALEPWLRAHAGRFLLVAAIGAPASAAPVTPANEAARPLPRIAIDDLAFADRPGGELRPRAWSQLARQRAEALALERAIAVDRALASLLTLVERAAPGAAVVVVGDPPADRGAHGLVARPGLFDDTLRTTLVVSTPGLARPGRAAAALVSARDLAPTLLELARLPPEPKLAGRSLMPFLADPSAVGRDEVVSGVERKAGRLGRSARNDRWRFNEWPDGSTELYDHAGDPLEITNLASRPEQQATVAELRRSFDLPPAAPVAAAPAAPAATRPRPRNVLLVIVDDLNTQVGAWGAPVKTPAIDRLAALGTRFDRAYVPVAMCSPSRVSILTGWRPERTGVWNNQDPPRPAGSTPLQEHFARHGARTVAIGKVFHFPEDFRWDVREEHPELVEDERADAAAEAGEGLFVRAPGGDLDQPDGRRARRAARLLAAPTSRPFFMAVGFVRPHRRWIAPARYFDLYPPAAVPLAAYPRDDLGDVPAIAVKTKPQPLPGLPLLGREPPGLVVDAAVRRQAIAAYEACVTFADAQVGVLLDTLDRRNLWKDTVVVLFGDNGYHLGEHAGLLRKDTLFEEALRVPLVVVAPGASRPGTVVRTPVSLVDLYPTLVELAGLPPVAGLDGRSLVPLLANPDAPGREPVLSYRRVQPPLRGRSLRTAAARYTVWPDGSEELYDLRSTAAEAENLAGRPGKAALKEALHARLLSLVAGGRVD